MDRICLTEATQASDSGICWAYIGTYMETKWKEYIGWEMMVRSINPSSNPNSTICQLYDFGQVTPSLWPLFPPPHIKGTKIWVGIKWDNIYKVLRSQRKQLFNHVFIEKDNKKESIQTLKTELLNQDKLILMVMKPCHFTWAQQFFQSRWLCQALVRCEGNSKVEEALQNFGDSFVVTEHASCNDQDFLVG